LLLRLFVPLLRFFVLRLFGARLKLVDTALLLGEGCGGGRLLLERAPLARTISAIAVASATVAASAPVLFAFAFGAWRLGLARELMELGRFA
jgi:hypothetical protein